MQIKIDEAVQKLSAEAYEVALTQMRDNREAIDRITEVLCEKETITGDEFRALLSEYTTIPDENLEAAKTPEMPAEALSLIHI